MTTEILQERVQFAGSRSMLIGELAYPMTATTFSCLLVNPHPYMGGQMVNSLIRHLAAALAAQGAVTLRFDYSGVGDSAGNRVDTVTAMARFWETGTAPDDPRMVEDVGGALDWLIAQSDLPTAVIGYSFGAHAAVASLSPQVWALILISPTVCQHDFSGLDSFSGPVLVVHGEDDFATPRPQLESWFKRLREPKQVCFVPGGEHFFRGCEDRVVDACAGFLDGWLARRAVV